LVKQASDEEGKPVSHSHTIRPVFGMANLRKDSQFTFIN